MFGKKTSIPPWYLQVLTHDYSVEGFGDPEHINLLFVQLDKPSHWTLSGVTLTQPQLTSTGPLALPIVTGQEFATAFDKIVAFIPRDTASQTHVQENYGRIDHETDAICLAGPYLVKGRLALRTKQVMADSFLLVRNAEITCQLPHNPWPGLTVPMALLHPTWLQGYLSL
jgi:hypothetical protein